MSYIYERNNIKFRTAKKHRRLPLQRFQVLIQERKDFAIRYVTQIAGPGRRKKNFVWIDETTFTLWPANIGKTWQNNTDKVSVPENYTRLTSFTLFAACGPALNEIVYMLTEEGTTIPAMKRFVIMVARARRNQYGDRPYIIMDNAKAHKDSEVIRQMENHFIPVYMPPYSSNFNIVESIFSILKEQYRVRLFRRDSNINTMAEFK